MIQPNTSVIIILSILLYISCVVLVYLGYSSKHDKLYQGLDNIVYLRYCVDFDSITVVLKV